MSVVTNLILAAGTFEHDYESGGERRLTPGLAAVRAWCEGAHLPADEPRSIDLIGWPPSTVDAASGGTKHMECCVYAWGANYLVLGDFLEAVRTAPWRYPGRVQVFAKEQDDEIFSVYTLTAERTWLRWPPTRT